MFRMLERVRGELQLISASEMADGRQDGVQARRYWLVKDSILRYESAQKARMQLVCRCSSRDPQMRGPQNPERCITWSCISAAGWQLRNYFGVQVGRKYMGNPPIPPIEHLLLDNSP
jgi:hypothetical protein